MRSRTNFVVFFLSGCLFREFVITKQMFIVWENSGLVYFQVSPLQTACSYQSNEGMRDIFVCKANGHYKEAISSIFFPHLQKTCSHRSTDESFGHFQEIMIQANHMLSNHSFTDCPQTNLKWEQLVDGKGTAAEVLCRVAEELEADYLVSFTAHTENTHMHVVQRLPSRRNVLWMSRAQLQKSCSELQRKQSSSLSQC